MKKILISFINKFGLNLNTLLEFTAVIAVWRGIWILMDLYIFPNNQLASALTGVIVGLAFLLFDDLLLKEIKQGK